MQLLDGSNAAASSPAAEGGDLEVSVIEKSTARLPLNQSTPTPASETALPVAAMPCTLPRQVTQTANATSTVGISAPPKLAAREARSTNKVASFMAQEVGSTALMEIPDQSSVGMASSNETRDSISDSQVLYADPAPSPDTLGSTTGVAPLWQANSGPKEDEQEGCRPEPAAPLASAAEEDAPPLAAWATGSRAQKQSQGNAGGEDQGPRSSGEAKMEGDSRKSDEGGSEGFPSGKVLSTLEQTLKFQKSRWNRAETQEAKQATRSEEIRQLFDLAPEEILLEEFNCALVKKVPLQGKIYVFEGFLCFYSNIFGLEKVVIPLASVTQACRAKTAGMFPNAIELVASGRKYFFTSFLNREEAYRYIVFGWARKSGHARLALGEDTPDLDPATSAFALKWESKRRGSESAPHSPRATALQEESLPPQAGAGPTRQTPEGSMPAPRTSPRPPRPESQPSPWNPSQAPGADGAAKRTGSPGSAGLDETSRADNLDVLEREAGATPAGSAGLLVGTGGSSQGNLGLAASEADNKVDGRDTGGGSCGQTGDNLDSCTTASPKPPTQLTDPPPAASMSPRCAAADPVSGGTGADSKQQPDDRSQPGVSSAHDEGGRGRGEEEDRGGPESLWSAAKEREAPAIPRSMSKISSTKLEVTCQRFFQLFFSDASTVFLHAFHAARGDKDLEVSAWEKDESGIYARELNFRHPINFFIGPKATACRQLQRLEVFRGDHLVLHTEQRMMDIPYGEHFSVNARWDVTPYEATQGATCEVSIAMEVPFSKKVLLQGAIEKGAINESRQVYREWLRQAQATLSDRPEAPHLQQSESPGAVRGSAGGERPVDEATARILALLAEGRIPEEDAEEIRRMLNLEGPRGSARGAQSPLSRGSRQSWDSQGGGLRSSGEKFGGAHRRVWFAGKSSGTWFGSTSYSDWRERGKAMLAWGHRNGNLLLALLLLVCICLQLTILANMRSESGSTPGGAAFQSASAHSRGPRMLFPEGAQPWTPPLSEEAALWWDHRLRQLQETLEYELARVQLHLQEPSAAAQRSDKGSPDSGTRAPSTNPSDDAYPTVGSSWHAFLSRRPGRK